MKSFKLTTRFHKANGFTDYTFLSEDGDVKTVTEHTGTVYDTLKMGETVMFPFETEPSVIEEMAQEYSEKDSDTINSKNNSNMKTNNSAKFRKVSAKVVSGTLGTAHLGFTMGANAVRNAEASINEKLIGTPKDKTKKSRDTITQSKIEELSLRIEQARLKMKSAKADMMSGYVKPCKI